MVALYPEDLRGMLVQAFKSDSSLLEFSFGLNLMVHGWAHSKIGQVTSDQDQVNFGKLLEVEGIELAVNVADGEDPHPALVVPKRRVGSHQPIALWQARGYRSSLTGLELAVAVNLEARKKEKPWRSGLMMALLSL
jgi:hypothetical protein